jgi:hypothetical protein
MNPELQQAITERRQLGYSDEAIQKELIEAGYDTATIHQILTSSHATALPGVMHLFQGAVDYVKERYDLALVLSLPLVVMSLLEYLELAGVLSASVSLLASVFNLILIIVYYVLFLAVINIVIQKEETAVSFSDSWRWASHNFFGFIWLSILSTLIIWGGFVLLIIPGLLMSLYFYLSQYVFVAEHKTGFSALSRSHDLITGVWWPVLGRLVGVGLLFFIFFIVVLVLVGLATYSLADNQVLDFLTSLMIQLFASIMTVCNIYIGTQIYHARKSFVTSKPVKQSKKTILYSVFIAITVAVITFGVVLVTTNWEAVQSILRSIDERENPAELMTEDERQAAKDRAQQMREQN